MVRANNSYDGINESPMDDYIRNLNDSRVGIELSFLPVIDYFVCESESSEEKVLLPSKIFEDQRDYLRELGMKYHNRGFDFMINPEDSFEVYDNLTKLIRKSRKTVEYCLLDSIEFMTLREDLFERVNIPRNVALSIAAIHSDYPALKFPKNIKNVLSTENFDFPSLKKSENKNHQKGFNKFKTPFNLYSYVLSDVKRTIDFEALKVYDFLLETNLERIRSNKLIEIGDRLRDLGESEYCKKSYDVYLEPLRLGGTEKDIIIDEWSSNIRRLFELKDSVAKDFIDFLEKNDDERILFESGVYPELLGLCRDFN